jgi:hypothetical protein
VSSTDHTAPALVWVRDGEISEIHRANFETGLNLRPQVWSFHEGRSIFVRKEESSRNGFSSLEFVDECCR